MDECDNYSHNDHMAIARKLAKDTYLFRENDSPDNMYIVKSGTIAITKTKGTTEIVLAELTPGAMLGEMALFDAKPRSANAKAVKDTEVIALPYPGLKLQMEQLPAWVRAIIKTMSENLREANKRIRLLDQSKPDDERFPPHVINKFLSIFNLVSLKYGSHENGVSIVPAGMLRKYTIQVFQEATNKMQSVMDALKAMNCINLEDLGEGKIRITNLQPEVLFEFVEWYNDFLFKPDKDKPPMLNEQEVKILTALIEYAKKSPEGKNGSRKVSLTELQNDSMKDFGFLIKGEDINSLVEKNLISEKTMEETGVYTHVLLENVERPCLFWGMANNLRKQLR